MPRKVFVSYSSQDREIARTIVARLQKSGAEVFFDEAIPAGARFTDRIEEALSTSNAYVFILSPGVSDSKWLQFELGVIAARAADDPDVKIIPVLVEGARWSDVPWPLKSRKGLMASGDQIGAIADEVTAAVAA